MSLVLQSHCLTTDQLATLHQQRVALRLVRLALQALQEQGPEKQQGAPRYIIYIYIFDIYIYIYIYIYILYLVHMVNKCK